MGRAANSNGLRVLDTHAFAFSPAFVKESGLPERLDGTLDPLVEDMDRAGVDRTMATLFVTRNDDLFESVEAGLKRHKGRIAAQLNIAPNRPHYAAANLLAAAKDVRVAGARVAPSLFRLHPVDESLEEVWDACEHAKLPVQIVLDGSRFCDPRSFAILAKARPDLTLVLSVSSPRHREGMRALSKHPRVFFQVPGLLDGEIKRGQPAFLRWAAKNLPVERLMFGSDRLGREASYFAKVKALDALDEDARQHVAGRTAADVYGPRLPAWRAG